jgi:hypothetical protein
MKQNEHGRKARTAATAESPSGPAKPALIHPVVIYPFQHPDDYANLEELYRLAAKLDSHKQNYARPITVIDRKTHTAALRDKRYLPFREGVVGRHSDMPANRRW